MYNATFVCICCQRKLFECNVSKWTTKLETEIESKKGGLYNRAIELFESKSIVMGEDGQESEIIEWTPILTNVNGEESPYVCHACKKHLKSGKLPPMSAKNGLFVYNHEPELELTELEGNLIAKNIVFMKNFQLPKSRWTALKDKIINVPVNDADILNTMERLPRTPDEAGLVEVDLKRKVEFKNTHLRQLINPDKCYKMLDLLKNSKNPYYQFYDDYNIYTERCRREDFKGYTIVFDEEVEIIQDLSDMYQSPEERAY